MIGLFRRRSSFGQSTNQPARPNLRVEALEGRTVPAVFNIANGDVAGLVAAITTANTNAEPDTINLAAGGTFTLTVVDNTTNGLPVILADGGNGLTINGDGATVTRDSAAPNMRILEINNGAAPLAINNVTISGGKTPGSEGGGIRVNASANLTLTGSTVSGNTNATGGGIGVLAGATLNLTNSTISGNTTTAKGGGLWTRGSGGVLATVNIQSSTISGNTAGSGGGGAFLYTSNVTISNSTISGNTSGARGGGAELYKSTGLIQNTTISDNTAGNRGGGLFFYKGTNTVANTTITRNTSSGPGGGVVLYLGTQTLVNCTISDNTANTQGGGIYVQRSSTVANLQNTIVAGNTDSMGANDVFRTGGTLNASNNLIQNLPGGTINGTDTANITGVDPLLGTLQNNGGTTRTLALSTNSPAVDAGSAALATAAGLTTDQRGTGYTRANGVAPDIGAFELQPPTITSINPASGPQTGGTTVMITGTNFTGATAVTFGSAAASSFTVNSSTSITATAPAGTGTVDVTVTTFDGTSGTSATDQFTFTAPKLSTVATGPGTAARVNVLNPDGSIRFTVQPFGEYRGGATTSSGDVNDDGVADIVVGAGAGATGGHVKVFDGATGEEIQSFFAFDGFAGGVTVGAGDVNDDGVADVLVGAGAGASGGHVKAFDGVTGAEIRSFFAFEGFTGGVTVGSSDMNGDGVDDIVVGATGGHVKVFDGLTGAEIRSFFAFDTGFTGGVTVGVGDVNDDGFADIVVGAGPGARPHVKAFDGVTGAEIRSFFAFDTGFTGGVTVVAGDVNGDGIADIVVGAGPGAGPHVKVFDGLTGEELRSFFAFDEFSGGVVVG